MKNNNDVKLYRGMVFYFKENTTLNEFSGLKEEDIRFFNFYEDGVLAVENGIVKEAGEYNKLLRRYQNSEIIDYSGCLITPGFIDTHLHVTQSGVVAAYGEKLLEWLNSYVFPRESIYKDTESARKDINFFLNQLLKNGTTTACGFGPLRFEAADILFQELDKRNMRFITGNNMQDRNSPEYLCLSTKENIEVTEKLIKKWNGKAGRQHYAITPRFAYAGTEELLDTAGQLKRQYPELYVQTHIDENLNEIKSIKELFPWSRNYLDVYDKFGLVTDKSIFGHCIYITPEEYECFSDRGAIISSCPVSNNFLGSGLFNFKKMMEYTDKITLGSDWAAGNTLSMFAVMDEFYKISLLQDFKVYSMTRWFLSTLGSAKALGLDNYIGSFASGKEADFIVIDPSADDIVKYRFEMVDDIYEMLFILMTLGDTRLIKDTYVYGNRMTY